MELPLKDKTILITGGTSRLGQAFVRKAVQAGANVFFSYFKASETARELERIGPPVKQGEARPFSQGGAQGFALDLADAKAIEAFASAFGKKVEQLDILIHNAAASADALIEKMSEKQWEDVLRVNLKAPFYLTQKLLPLLMETSSENRRAGLNLPCGKKGAPSKIFMLISRAGLSGLAGAANYAASKGGLIAMTQTLAQELGRKKILVNAVNPGFMKSAMTEGLPEHIFQRNLEMSSLKTVSDPDEVADFLVFLSSDQMRQVTGQVFHFESRPL